MEEHSKKRHVSFIGNVRYPELLIVFFILLVLWDLVAWTHVGKLLFL